MHKTPKHNENLKNVVNNRFSSLIADLKSEYLSLSIVLGLIILMFQIVYYNENFFNTIKISLTIFLLFIIPGYIFMLNYARKLDFIERLVVGTILTIGIIGSLSYLTGLVGFHSKYHWAFAIVTMFAGLILYIFSNADN